MSQSPPHDPNHHVHGAASQATLGGRALSGGAIRMLAQAFQVVLGLGSGMALARLLTPADFGLFAMVGSLTAFIGSFRDFGLPNATVYQQEIDHEQLSALFWLNVRLNLVIVLFVVAMAPVLVWFYGEARLVPITLVIAAGLFVFGMAVQHESLLTRQMRFGALTLVETGSLLFSVSVAVGLGLLGAGYWALVGQFLANALVRTGTAWMLCRWRPGSLFAQTAHTRTRLQSILSYGRHVTGARIVTHIGRNLDRVLVGYFGGAAAMGLYDKSYQWSIFPINQVNGPLLSVTVASLSRVRHDPDRYRAYCRQGLLPLFALCLPALAFMVVEAHNVVLLLLGQQWVEAIPLFRLLCVGAFVSCASTAIKPLYLAQGATRRQLVWGLISTPIMVAAVAAGSRWGAYGVAVGFTTATCLLAYPSVVFCLQTSHLSMRDFWGIVWPPATASIAAALVLLAAKVLLPPAPSFVVELAATGALFSLVYLLLWAVLPSGRETLRMVLRLASAAWRRRWRTAASKT